MAQVSTELRLQNMAAGTVPVDEAFLSLIGRDDGRLIAPEGEQLDFKRQINLDDSSCVAELARDIMAFANSQGGILAIGVNDDGFVVGTSSIDGRRLRDSLGPYMGTRIDFDILPCRPVIQGRQVDVLLVAVRRSVASYPTLLRRDVEFRRTFQKVKYAKGSLFFRQKNETLVEPADGDVDGRAAELGFTSAAPRTRTSFFLKEDRPLLRLYENINDRFFGRENEKGELLAKFDDPRGKGVSIAGLGGVGKTELAITLVKRLHELGRFKVIYSGSAKRTVLTPAGPQATDPAFVDLISFLRDLAAWLGVNSTGQQIEDLKKVCLGSLAKQPRTLLFIDNLETVEDRRLFDLLENELPSNCWVLTTGRVHRIRNFVYQKELGQLEMRDAAHLLRYELKRQGLLELANEPVQELEKRAETLFCHPLALRWFAWACRRRPDLWTGQFALPDKAQLEEFCVSHTLNAISTESQRTLGAILATNGVADATPGCIAATTGLSVTETELALYELEVAGLVSPTQSEGGAPECYVVPALAEQPGRELARNRGWEPLYIANLKAYLKKPETAAKVDPLLRDLLDFPLSKVKALSEEERDALESRIGRAEGKCPAEHVWSLLALRAESQRHRRNLISSDDLYARAAAKVLEAGPVTNLQKQRIQVLLEAATVAKARGQTTQQLGRAIVYLEAIHQTDFAPHRVLGMLSECSAIVGNLSAYREYRGRAEAYAKSHKNRLTQSQLEGLEDALRRADDRAGGAG